MEITPYLDLFVEDKRLRARVVPLQFDPEDKEVEAHFYDLLQPTKSPSRILTSRSTRQALRRA